MGARAHTIETELALAIGNDVGAILKIEAHTGHPDFTIVLDAVFIAISKHFADNIGAIREHATHDIHFCGCRI